MTTKTRTTWVSSETFADKIFNDAGFIPPANSIPQIPAVCQVPCWCWENAQQQEAGPCSWEFHCHQGGWEFERWCYLDTKENVTPGSWIEDMTYTDYKVRESTTNVCWLPPTCQALCWVPASRSSILPAPLPLASPSLFRGIFRHNKSIRHWCPYHLPQTIPFCVLHLEIAL